MSQLAATSAALQMTSTTAMTVVSSAGLALIVAGLAGNVLSFIVFGRKRFRTVPVATYYRVLAVFDSTTLIVLSRRLFERLVHVDLELLSTTSCRFFSYLSFAATSLSDYLLATISLDSYLEIRYAGKYRAMRKPGMQTLLVALNVTLNFLYYMPAITHKRLVPITTVRLLLPTTTTTMTTAAEASNKSVDSFISSNDVRDTNTTPLVTLPTPQQQQTLFSCSFIGDGRMVLNVMDFVSSALLPFSLMLCFTVATISVVYRSRARLLTAGALEATARATVSNAATIATTANTASSSVVALVVPKRPHATPLGAAAGKRVRRRDAKFALNSIVLNLTFLAFNMPLLVYNLISGYVAMSETDEEFGRSVLLVLYYIYFGSRTLINLCVNSIFRKEFFDMISTVSRQRQGRR